MQRQPSRHWTIRELAAAAEAPDHNVKAYLGDLCKEGAITKVRRGVYGLSSSEPKDDSDFIDYLTSLLPADAESQKVRQVNCYVAEWGKPLPH